MSTPFQPQQGGQPQRGSTAKKKQQSSGMLGSLLGGGKTYFLLALLAFIGAVLGSLLILGRSADRATYYVLDQDIPARTQVTSSMLVPVDTAAGTEPENALDPADLSVEPLFARIPLAAGDVVTPATVGPLDRIDTNLPPDFVVVSFEVQPQNAVAGKVRRGDLIDVIAIGEFNGETFAKVVLHRVLVLDVTTNPSSIAQGANDSSVENAQTDPGPESNAVRGGIPVLYTVAVSPEDAAKIALVRGSNLMVALSANEPSENNLDVYVTNSEVFGTEGVTDSSSTVDLETWNDGVIVNDGTTGETVEGGTAVPSGEAAPSGAPSPSGTVAPATPGAEVAPAE